MSEKLTAAIEELVEHLRQQLQEVADTKRTINALRRKIGEQAMFDDVEGENLNVRSAALKPDQFYGKPLATAAQEYLDARRQACTADEIVQGLDAGGFDFHAIKWRDNDRIRSLSISLAKNSKTFHRLPNGRFGLLAWYPEVQKRAERLVRSNLAGLANVGEEGDET